MGVMRGGYQIPVYFPRLLFFMPETLSIVIPAYNEQDRLGTTLGSIAAAWQGAMKDLLLSQVIVSDDGSNDSTVAIAEGWKTQLPMHIVRLPHNKGKGAAVRAGMQQVTGDLALIYDADGAAPITEVNKLFAEMKTRKADIAIGSRVLEEGRSLVTMHWHRRVIGRVYHFLGSALVPGIQDTACGCKLFKADVAKKLFSLQRINRFAFDIEVLALALRLRYKIVEVPLAWTAVPESKVRIVRDGIEMFWCLVNLYVRSFRKS
jgi:dolichyl-phosphate beta-glucosyltransferase